MKHALFRTIDGQPGPACQFVVARSRVLRGASNADLALYAKADLAILARCHSAGLLPLVLQRSDNRPGLLLLFDGHDASVATSCLTELPSVAIGLINYDLTSMHLLMPGSRPAAVAAMTLQPKDATR